MAWGSDGSSTSLSRNFAVAPTIRTSESAAQHIHRLAVPSSDDPKGEPLLSESLRIRARRLLAEAAVIIASILLAFGVDAQWDLARERAATRALLASLAKDFAATVVEAEKVVGNHGGGLEAAERLILLAEARTLGASDAPEVDSLLSIIRVSGASFDPPQGAIGVLLEGGFLDSMDEPELLASLTAWPAEVADLQRQEARLASPGERLDDVLWAAGVRTDHLIATGHVGAAIRELPWERRPTEAWSVMNTAAGRNALAGAYLQLRFTKGSAEARLQSALEIKAMLKEVLR